MGKLILTFNVSTRGKPSDRRKKRGAMTRDEVLKKLRLCATAHWGPQPCPENATRIGDDEITAAFYESHSYDD